VHYSVVEGLAVLSLLYSGLQYLRCIILLSFVQNLCLFAFKSLHLFKKYIYIYMLLSLAVDVGISFR
jgi:hypothetical protein